MPTDTTSRFGCKDKVLSHQRATEPLVRNSEAQKGMSWLALRASVLRRAASQRGAAQERGAGGNFCASLHHCAHWFLNFHGRSASGTEQQRRCIGACSHGALRTQRNLHRQPQNISPQWVVALPPSVATKLLACLALCTRALLANQSLNRTVCGSPRLAVISFSAKHGPPQTAG
jgi:hypothetical protein